MRLAKWVFLPALLSAQTPPSDAVSVRSVAVEAPARGNTYFTVTIGLENRSKKPITAFRLSLISTFEDGSKTKQDEFVDLLPLYVIGQPAFRPGETYEYTASIYGDPLRVEAQVPAVAFDDHTVLGTTQDAFWLTTKRAAEARLLQSVIDVLKMMMVQSPDPESVGPSRERWFSYADPPSERDRMLYTVLLSTKGEKARIGKFISDSEASIRAMSHDQEPWSVEYK
jgi:hypothetical protein